MFSQLSGKKKNKKITQKNFYFIEEIKKD
jgi:hypothetical protein